MDCLKYLQIQMAIVFEALKCLQNTLFDNDNVGFPKNAGCFVFETSNA